MRLGTSVSKASWHSCSTADTIPSIVWSVTGRLPQAIASPERIFSRSNGSRTPPFFTTDSSWRSTRS